MEVLVNGQPYRAEGIKTVADLVSQLQLSGKFAIELNTEIIPRSEYPDVEIQAGDSIEVVEAIGGG